MCFASKPLFSIRDWATLLAIAVSSVYFHNGLCCVSTFLASEIYTFVA